MSDVADEPITEENPLESWEDGSAFGVAQDKDPVCKTPVEEWIKNVEITSTADVPIPKNLVDQVIGQEAASTTQNYEGQETNPTWRGYESYADTRWIPSGAEY